VSYVLAKGSRELYDPAVGAGAFFQAAKALASAQGRTIELSGAEIDPGSVKEALRAGLSQQDLSGVEIRDFVVQPPTRKYHAIAANPPYIRHHRLDEGLKGFLRNFGATLIGKPLDGRAGYHVYFFLRALQALEKGGHLAFIMPADVCEGVFAGVLWRWVLSNYRLDAVISFAPGATPFPGVDTNALIFLVANEEPKDSFVWARCLLPDTPSLREWVRSRFCTHHKDIAVVTRSLEEGASTGLSRAPRAERQPGPILLDFATVLRGIATGANDFFFLARERAAELGIHEEWLVPAIGRTRDAPADMITLATLKNLERKGRPTLLLSLDATPVQELPESLQSYIKQGERVGLHRKALIASRKPWYRMETRVPPPFLFAYLGRRNARFIRNLAGVVPLTGFLCVYPRQTDEMSIYKLWNVLCDPDTISNLPLVGKSYGAGAIKVEPRALERLPIPISTLRKYGLEWLPAPEQMELLPVSRAWW